MSISFCEGWFRARKVAVKPLTEAQARKRHNTKGALYTVLLGEPARPNAFIEIVSFDSAQVEYLDHLLRITGIYQFVMQPEGLLFMVMAAFNRFDDDGRSPAWSERFSFRVDGTTTRFERDYVNSPETESVTQRKVDVSLNWEPYPVFGKYESIARFERSQPSSLGARPVNSNDPGQVKTKKRSGRD